MYNKNILKLIFKNCIYNSHDDMTFFMPKQKCVAYYIIKTLNELYNNKKIIINGKTYGSTGRITKTMLLKVIRIHFLQYVKDMYAKYGNDKSNLREHKLHWIIRYNYRKKHISYNNVDTMCFNTVLASLRPNFISVREYGNAEHKAAGKHPYYLIKINPNGLELYKAWQEKNAGTLKEPEKPLVRKNKITNEDEFDDEEVNNDEYNANIGMA